MAQLLVSHPLMCLFALYLLFAVVLVSWITHRIEVHRGVTLYFITEKASGQTIAVTEDAFSDYVRNWTEQNRLTLDSECQRPSDLEKMN